ncbi:MAG: hypothetical protein KC635_11250 [Myxococcales bacterium]|nr:hypothetical protein [Myxococcales bacterium]
MRRALAVALVALLAPACAHGLDGYQDALGAWRAGKRAEAVAITGEEYARWRDGNHLEEARMRRLADEARETLEEVPVVPRGPRGAAPAPGVAGDESLSDALRADLLSGDVTPILRAASTVAGLHLEGHAFELITVVFRREAIRADGGLLDGLDDATRSVAAKRFALDALTRLAAP